MSLSSLVRGRVVAIRRNQLGLPGPWWPGVAALTAGAARGRGELHLGYDVRAALRGGRPRGRRQDALRCTPAVDMLHFSVVAGAGRVYFIDVQTKFCL